MSEQVQTANGRHTREMFANEIKPNGRIAFTNDVHEARKGFTEDMHLTAEATGRLDSHVMTLIKNAQDERERRENIRASLRNRNRMYALLAVLIVELVMPVVFSSHLLPQSWEAYEVLMITAPDAFITLYAWLRKY